MEPEPDTHNPSVTTDIEIGGPNHASAPAPDLADRAGASVLAEVLSLSGEARRAVAAPASLDRFLHEPLPERALCMWLGLRDPATPRPARSEITRRLTNDIARIDELVADQLGAILHHPTFQKLEASWRGLSYLVKK